MKIHPTLPLPLFDDKPKEECGVVGVYSPSEEASRKTYFALYALQHRGQESAGIASMGHAAAGNTMQHHKQTGLVSQVFNENILASLTGHMAVGHNRYATSGSKTAANAGPYVFNTIDGMIAVSHNGNITNAKALRDALFQRGVALSTNTDSELLALLIAAPLSEQDAPTKGTQQVKADKWVKRLQRLLTQAEGAYSLTLLTETGVYALRDALGLRPLCVGQLPHPEGLSEYVASSPEMCGHVFASESCALDTLGAKLLRDVAPGEVLRRDASGLAAFARPDLDAGARTPAPVKALCSFEFVYFARPDSVIEQRVVHSVRQDLGRRLAHEAPALADMVIPVPDSSIPAALGFAAATGIAYGEGFTKSRYIARTFIAPDQALRRLGVRMKFNPLAANVRGKRLVLVDDSIVRGNTIAPLIKLLRDAGALEIHVRVSSPPVKHPCFMGVDMASKEDLIANQFDAADLAQRIGADSLRYLSLEGLMQVIGDSAHDGAKFCGACFSGRYPLALPESFREKA